MSTQASFISIFACAVKNNSANYISIPITTGKNELKWFSEYGSVADKDISKAKFYEMVVQPNVQRGITFVDMIRTRDPQTILIEPLSLAVSNWSETDYREFWVEVINKFAIKSYFSPEWNYSKGCTLEFLTCIKKGIPSVDLNDHAISVEEGKKLIDSAVEEYRQYKIDVEFISNISSELEIVLKGHKE